MHDEQFVHELANWRSFDFGKLDWRRPQIREIGAFSHRIDSSVIAQSQGNLLVSTHVPQFRLDERLDVARKHLLLAAADSGSNTDTQRPQPPLGARA